MEALFLQPASRENISRFGVMLVRRPLGREQIPSFRHHAPGKSKSHHGRTDHTDQEKPKPLQHGGMEVAEKAKFTADLRGWALIQKQNSNCSFWRSDHRITGSTDHQISIRVIRGKVWV